jgi:hypothetical protein
MFFFFLKKSISKKTFEEKGFGLQQGNNLIYR